LIKSADTSKLHHVPDKLSIPDVWSSNHRAKFVVPVSLYLNDVPNNRKLLASALMSKYLMADSVAPLDDLLITHRV
jgi:hypothetical protein